MNAVAIRGWIYVSIAVLLVWTGFFERVVAQLLEGNPVEISWYQWVLISLTSIVQALLALRAYLDGTPERAKTKAVEELKTHDQIPP